VSAATSAVVVLRPGEGAEAPDALGDPRVVKASAVDTAGAYTLHETTKAPGRGAPPHVHYKHEEAFYVLDGSIEFTIDETRITAGAGSFVLVPRGTRHAFEVIGDAPARYLCIFSPPITQKERESLAQQLRAMNRSGS
jgi:quercetin dioxygenase-like cupin family protein